MIFVSGKTIKPVSEKFGFWSGRLLSRSEGVKQQTKENKGWKGLLSTIIRVYQRRKTNYPSIFSYLLTILHNWNSICHEKQNLQFQMKK